MLVTSSLTPSTLLLLLMMLLQLITIALSITASTGTGTSINSSTDSSTGTIHHDKRKQQQQQEVDDILSSMTILDKIGQMAQIDIHLIFNYNENSNRYEPDLEKIEYYFGKLAIGSLLITPIITNDDDDTIKNPNPPNTYFTAKTYRNLIIQIQQISTQYNNPPVIISIDTVHGANYIRNAIITPQQLNIANTFNRTNSYLVGRLGSKDSKAAGITFIYSPILGLGIESLWSRIYETFGEDPLVVGVMGRSMIQGIQFFEIDTTNSTVVTPSRSAACAKHFIGYSSPRTGHDRSPSWIPNRHLHQYFVKPWRHVLTPQPQQQQQQQQDTGSNNGNQNEKQNDVALTVMESYTEYDGVPNVNNKQSLNQILRQTLQFKGVIITDYQEIFNLVYWHKVALDETEAVKSTLVEGSVDISMIPFDFDGWKDNVLKSMGIDPSNTAMIADLDSNHLNKQQSQHSQQSKSKSKSKSRHYNKYAPYPIYPNIVKLKRIDESVERILKLKQTLNMFHETLVLDEDDDDNLQIVGTIDDRKMVYDIVKESIILVQNNNENGSDDNDNVSDNDMVKTLPIPKKQNNNGNNNDNNIRVHVTGPTANAIRYQSGGWTIQWQGQQTTDDHFSYGTTVLDAAMNVPHWNVTSSCGVDVLGNECGGGNGGNGGVGGLGGESHNSHNNLDLHKVSNSDYVIICIGEEAYAEKPGDIRDLQLPSGQIDFVRQVKKIMKEKNKGGKIILVYFGGRPRLLGDMVGNSDAIVLAFLPGPDGGQAVIDLINGDYNPSGRLSITYPKYADKGGVPYWHAVTDMCTEYNQYQKCEVQWSFGHGLSYTQFEYTELKVSGTQLDLRRSNQFKAEVDISVKVQNIGKRSGSETIMLFLFIENRLVTPEQKLLWYFDKVHLDDGEETIVKTQLSIDHLRHIGPHDDTHLIIQPGMSVKVGVGPNVDCRGIGIGSDLCSESITIVLKEDEQYEASCEEACSLWDKSGCGSQYNFNSRQCLTKCYSSDSSTDIDSRGWGWNYVSCIEPIVLDETIDNDQLKCSRMTSMCRNVLQTSNDDVYTNIEKGDDYLLNMAVALSAGLIGIIMMLSSLLRSQRQSQRHGGDIEFTPIEEGSFS